MNDIEMIRKLERPEGTVRMVLDTDTYNEIDDQFAIAYALKSPDRIALEAIYAAPFFNSKSVGPEDGMEKSYSEILKLLRLAGREDMIARVYKGSRSYLETEKKPVPSPTANDLVTRARACSLDDPLYIVAIGAITNIASALILAPDIAERIVVVWLGGHALHWPDTHEFNMFQDVAAARVVFDSGAPLVQLPALGVVDHCAATKPELEYWLVGKNPLATYLAENTIAEAESYAKGRPWSRVIWDVAAIGWVLDQAGTMMQDRLERRPIPEYDDHYGFDPGRPFMKYVWAIDRDALFADMFQRLAK